MWEDGRMGGWEVGGGRWEVGGGMTGSSFIPTYQRPKPNIPASQAQHTIIPSSHHYLRTVSRVPFFLFPFSDSVLFGWDALSITSQLQPNRGSA